MIEKLQNCLAIAVTVLLIGLLLPPLAVLCYVYLLPFLLHMIVHSELWISTVHTWVSFCNTVSLVASVLWYAIKLVFFVALGVGVLASLVYLFMQVAKVVVLLSEAQLKRAEAFKIRGEINEDIPINVGASGLVFYNRAKKAVQNIVAPINAMTSKAINVIDVTIPSLYDLLLSGDVTQDNIPVGVDESNKLLQYGRDGETSGMIAGQAGSGKSHTLAVKIALALWGGAKRVVLIDPHYNDPDQSIVARLGSIADMCEVVSDTWDQVESASKYTPILNAVNDFYGELQRRKLSKIKPINGWDTEYLVIDELADILDWHTKYGKIAEIMGRIAREGRKFNMFVWSATQLVQAEYIGGTQNKRSMSSYCIHSLSAEEASLLTGNSKGAKKILAECPDLEQGWMFFRGLKTKYMKVKVFSMPKDEMDVLAAFISKAREKLLGSDYTLPTKTPTLQTPGYSTGYQGYTSNTSPLQKAAFLAGEDTTDIQKPVKRIRKKAASQVQN